MDPAIDSVMLAELARRVRTLEKFVETHDSPLWKRCWFVCQGFRFRSVGRWLYDPQTPDLGGWVPPWRRG